jgi:hypothetical protein
MTMKTTMIRYTVKPDRAAENVQYVARVFDELARLQPASLHYACFTLDDGVSFVHLVAQEDGASPLRDVAAFHEFVTTVRDRCETPPVATPLTPIGLYALLGSAQS